MLESKITPLRQISHEARQWLNALEHLNPDLMANGQYNRHSYTIKLWKHFEKIGYHLDYPVYSIYLYRDNKAKSYRTVRVRSKALATFEEIKSKLA